MKKNQELKMANIDFDDEFELPKGSPLALLVIEDLAEHSVEALNSRLEALKAEAKRTEQAIADKGVAKLSAESIFK